MKEISTLVRLAKDGDRAAFGELYDQHVERIYTFLYYRTLNRETAEDLTSTVFLKALEKIAQFNDKGEGSFAAWLYAIARTTAIDHARQKGRTTPMPEHFDPPENVPSARRAEAQAELASVMKALDTLSAAQKEIVLLRAWDGLSFGEIAAVLQKSEASCKMQYSRAVNALRSQFAPLALLFLTLHL